MQRAVVLGMALVALAACTRAGVQRTDWVVAESAVGPAVHLLVFAGHSSCLDYRGVEVSESSDEVHIRAYVFYNGDEGCTDDFVAEPVTVTLDEPLGDRRLVGCADQEIRWRGWNLPEDADCSAPRPF